MFKKIFVPLHFNFTQCEKMLNMSKNTFTRMVTQPQQFTSQERGWLRAMTAKYPYSSIVRLMALLADRAYGFDTAQERRAVALSLDNGCPLDTLLSQSKAAAPTPATDTSDFDIIHEINNYQEISFKTAPKSVILSNFLQSAPTNSRENERPEPVSDTLSDKKSIAADGLLGTETLAVILEKQGKYRQAITIYKNLINQNPEKSSIFAPRIERLQTLMNEKN